MAVVLALLARANEEKARKSIALDILRTESARQLQEIWISANSYFAIKSETLSAMAGMEVSRLTDGEHRFTIALVAEGNPLDRVLRVAPLVDQLENAMSSQGERPTRLDLRVYKNHSSAISDLVKGEIDFAQINLREFLRARQFDSGIQPLVTILPGPGFNDTAVIFTRKNTGIKTLGDLRGKSFLLGTGDSTMSFWTKVRLLQAGIHAGDLSKYRYTDRANDVLGGHVSEPAVAIGNPFSSMTPVEAVIAGVYDAAVVREKRFREVAVEQQLVALDRFEDSGDMLVARGKISADASRVFQTAVIGLNDSRSEQGLVAAPVRFRAATEEDLKEMSAKLETEVSFER
jgi:hypothetical protein